MQLNEGLEKLGEEEPIDGSACRGEAFRDTAIESIRLPSTLKRIEYRAFNCCESLRSIEIPSGVECIGERCFCESGIEEITLPSTLKEIGVWAFDRTSLKTVFVEEGCALDVRKYVGQNVEVRPK